MRHGFAYRLALQAYTSNTTAGPATFLRHPIA